MILSIIIPHKNSSALLERLLMSIPSNDEFEVIVVDDNSKKCEKENLCNNHYRDDAGVIRDSCDAIVYAEGLRCDLDVYDVGHVCGAV